MINYHPPLVYDEVEVGGNLQLDSLGEISDIEAQTIKELNPELLQGSTLRVGQELEVPLESCAARCVSPEAAASFITRMGRCGWVGNVQRRQRCTIELTPSIHRHIVALIRPKINLLWTGQLLVRVCQHFFPLRNPAGSTRNRK